MTSASPFSFVSIPIFSLYFASCVYSFCYFISLLGMGHMKCLLLFLVQFAKFPPAHPLYQLHITMAHRGPPLPQPVRQPYFFFFVGMKRDECEIVFCLLYFQPFISPISSFHTIILCNMQCSYLMVHNFHLQ